VKSLKSIKREPFGKLFKHAFDLLAIHLKYHDKNLIVSKHPNQKNRIEELNKKNLLRHE
jgi:hypothetical protein